MTTVTINGKTLPLSLSQGIKINDSQKQELSQALINLRPQLRVFHTTQIELEACNFHYDGAHYIIELKDGKKITASPKLAILIGEVFRAIYAPRGAFSGTAATSAQAAPKKSPRVKNASNKDKKPEAPKQKTSNFSSHLFTVLGTAITGATQYFMGSSKAEEVASNLMCPAVENLAKVIPNLLTCPASNPQSTALVLYKDPLGLSSSCLANPLGTCAAKAVEMASNLLFPAQTVMETCSSISSNFLMEATKLTPSMDTSSLGTCAAKVGVVASDAVGEIIPGLTETASSWALTTGLPWVLMGVMGFFILKNAFSQNKAVGLEENKKQKATIPSNKLNPIVKLNLTVKLNPRVENPGKQNPSLIQLINKHAIQMKERHPNKRASDADLVKQIREGLGL